MISHPDESRETFRFHMAIIIDQLAEQALREISRKRHFQTRSEGQKRRWAKSLLTSCHRHG